MLAIQTLLEFVQSLLSTQLLVLMAFKSPGPAMASKVGALAGKDGACSRFTAAQLDANKQAAKMRGMAFNFAVIIFIPQAQSGKKPLPLQRHDLGEVFYY